MKPKVKSERAKRGGSSGAARCSAAIWHGPGHQSKTNCDLTTPHHKKHHAIYGSMDQEAWWYGKKIFSGFFDEPPNEKLRHGIENQQL